VKWLFISYSTFYAESNYVTNNNKSPLECIMSLIDRLEACESDAFEGK